ncbi:DNA cytosine methyltransferase [Mannheimia pernigra]|uniref:DNA cytosine methyltransferase n=1 Tax=Mannheimia pernigra TaxID=111844 RepID=UPI003B524170
MGTGGNNIPCVLLDKEEIYASQEKRHAIETLCLLRGKVGEETFTKWGFRILNSFFKEEILQSPMYGKIIRSASFRKCGLEYSTLPRKKNHSVWKMLSLRKRECQRCSSQRWELPKQFSREFGTYLSELSQQATPKENLLQGMWQASKGIRILQQTLHQIQEIRRSKYVSRQTIIRKLSVIECERLQGFSDDWTKIPYRGKSAEECPDSPRYKAIGNSMAVPCMRWIGQRLNDYLTQSL